MSPSRLHPDEDVRLDQAVRVQSTSPRRSGWTWFWAAFSVVLLVGVSILYLASRPGDEGAVAAGPEGATPPAADDPEPADDPIPVPTTQTSGVLLSAYMVESFGFPSLEETYTDATEVGESDAGTITKVVATLDAVDWPDGLTDPVATLRTDLTGLVTALEAGDLDAAREGFAAVRSSQHDFSTGVYDWLASATVVTDEPDAPADGVIEIDMFEFGYAPDSIEIKAGVPTVLRFTNSGKLPHEAMVGDAHMQEEFASADDHDDDAGDDHHGDLMAVTVDPGDSADLEVLLEEPGTWYFACHLVGHYEQGQVATISVTG